MIGMRVFSYLLVVTRYTSDLLSLLGTVILWVFWPSFNALLASGAARHRAVINTYLSLMSSTVTTFVVSGILGERQDLVTLRAVNLANLSWLSVL